MFHVERKQHNMQQTAQQPTAAQIAIGTTYRNVTNGRKVVVTAFEQDSETLAYFVSFKREKPAQGEEIAHEFTYPSDTFRVLYRLAPEAQTAPDAASPTTPDATPDAPGQFDPDFFFSRSARLTSVEKQIIQRVGLEVFGELIAKHRPTSAQTVEEYIANSRLSARDRQAISNEYQAARVPDEVRAKLPAYATRPLPFFM